MIAPLIDRRVQLMSELIAGIQVVKMYAWEKPFSQIVSIIRKLEIKQIKFSSYIRAAYLAIIVFTERLTVYFTLITFVLMENNLTADVTYEISTYFNILQLVVASYFPQGLILLGESIVSFNRLEDFLLMDEVNTRRFSEITPQLQFKSQKPKEESNENLENQIDRYISRSGSIVSSEHQRLSDLPVYIKLQRVSANWISGQLPPTLYNINLTIKPGQLCAVVGAVGFKYLLHSDIDDSDYVENIPEAEMTAHGRVAGRVYKEYLHNGDNNFILFVLLMIFIISQVATIGNDYWLSYWTTLEDVRHIENTSDVKQFANMYNDSFLGSIFTLNPDGLLSTVDAIYVYTFCIIACIATTLFRSFLYMKVSMNSSINLHNIMFFKLLQRKNLLPRNPPPPTWPSQGQLNLNVSIKPGWKVGVVGRTDAGKSSLISELFRLFNEGLEGEIKVDTSTVGLSELRCKISIIPQEPVLFSESLRYNLDPFNQYDDLKLWEVLRQVELNDVTLDHDIFSGGHNFSVGQKQLICLARTILRNNRLLVLDEATANIDSHTDALIQDIIRSSFKECTIITIVHRLNTIIDSNRIIVMENGSIVEFGCPYELLHDKPNGYFSQMMEKTGNQMAQSLLEQAKKACEKNNDHCELNLSAQNTECESDSTLTEQTAL
ncbi:L259 protein, partial [Acromyrmex charruanus]